MKINKNHIILLLLISIVLLFKGYLIMPLLLVLILPGLCLSYLFKNIKFIDRVLLAFPLTLLSLIILYILSLFGLFLNKIIVISLILFIPLVTLIIKRREIINDLKSIELKQKPLIFFSVSVILIFLIWVHLLSSNGVALTDGVSYATRGIYLSQGLEKFNTIPIWHSNEALGYPYITLDMPLFYQTYGILVYIFGNDYISLFNQLYFIIFLYFFIGLFFLARYLLNSSLASLIATSLFAATPYLTEVSFYNGNIKLYLAICFVPAAILFFIKSIKENKHYLRPFFIILAIMLLSHINPAAFTLLFCGIYYIISNILEKKSAKEIKKSLINIAKESLFFIGIILYWAVPFFLYRNYTSNTSNNYILNFPTFNDIIKQIINNPGIQPDNNIGPLFFAIFLLGLIFLIIKRESKETVKTSIVLIATLLLAILSSRIIEPIGLLFNSFSRVMPFIILFACIIIANTYLLIKSKKFKIIFLVVLIITTAYYGVITYKRVAEYNNETVLSKDSFSKEKTYLKENLPGRTIVYGFYFTAVLPALNTLEIPVPSQGYQQGQHTDMFEGKLFDKSTFSIYQSQTAEETIRLLNLSYIKHLWFNICNQGGKYSYDKLKDFLKPVYYDNQCSIISELENTEFAVFSNKPERITTIRNSPVDIKFKADFKEGDNILVKEEYFPRWKAYDENGKYLETTMSKEGFILIKSHNTSIIYLSHRPLIFEIITGIISLSALITLILIGLTRKSKNDTD